MYDYVVTDSKHEMLQIDSTQSRSVAYCMTLQWLTRNWRLGSESLLNQECGKS